jgi:hypothetical protein
MKKPKPLPAGRWLAKVKKSRITKQGHLRIEIYDLRKLKRRRIP